MKIIMPHNNDPKNFGEHGHIARIVSDFALLEVNVGSVMVFPP